jgi:ABC-type antimicrobial peptide transport system permease subunit
VALALLAGRAAATLLFGLSSSDPVVYLVSALLLVVVTLAASAIPAFRASRVDPGHALRAD